MTEMDFSAEDRQLLEQVSVKVDQMFRTLVGEEDWGHIGLVRRVEVMEQAQTLLEVERKDGDKRAHDRIDKIEQRMNRITWTAIGIGIGAGVGTGGLLSLIVGG